MPSHRAHSYIDRIYLGKAYRKVHREMDWPYKIVGKDHRRYFHDIPNAWIIAEEEYPGDENAVASALLHIQYDKICSSNPYFKQQLEAAAWLDSRKRKRRKKKKRTQRAQLSKVEETLISDMKKLNEIRRLWYLFHSTNTASAL